MKALKLQNAWLITRPWTFNKHHVRGKQAQGKSIGVNFFFLNEPCAVFNCLHLGFAERQPPESPGELISIQQPTLGLSVDWWFCAGCRTWEDLDPVLNEGSGKGCERTLGMRVRSMIN